METNNNSYNWDAVKFFEELTAKNKLAQSEHFSFHPASGLEGFYDALNVMQDKVNFVCVSDISQGYTELSTSPKTRRVKTVFLAMRHAVDNEQARQECMDTMRELFRQFMSALFREKTAIEQGLIALDTRVNFNEIDRYIFSGCACAFFQIATETRTDLRYNNEEWTM